MTKSKSVTSKSISSTWVRIPRFNIEIWASKLTFLTRLHLLFVKSHYSIDSDDTNYCIIKYKVYNHKTYVMKVKNGINI